MAEPRRSSQFDDPTGATGRSSSHDPSPLSLAHTRPTVPRATASTRRRRRRRQSSSTSSLVDATRKRMCRVVVPPRGLCDSIIGRPDDVASIMRVGRFFMKLVLSTGKPLEGGVPAASRRRVSPSAARRPSAVLVVVDLVANLVVTLVVATDREDHQAVLLLPLSCVYCGCAGSRRATCAPLHHLARIQVDLQEDLEVHRRQLEPGVAVDAGRARRRPRSRSGSWSARTVASCEYPCGVTSRRWTGSMAVSVASAKSSSAFSSLPCILRILRLQARQTQHVSRRPPRRRTGKAPLILTTLKMTRVITVATASTMRRRHAASRTMPVRLRPLRMSHGLRHCVWCTARGGGVSVSLFKFFWYTPPPRRGVELDGGGRRRAT